MTTIPVVTYGTEKSTFFFLSSVTVIPAAAMSALPDVTAGMTESKSMFSARNSLPSLSATARHISTSMPAISCPRRNSYGGNVASVAIVSVSPAAAQSAAASESANAKCFILATADLTSL